MDKEQLSELVFASETLQKNLEEFKKLGDFGKIVQNLKGVEHLSTQVIRQHIESVDWNSIVTKATADSQRAFLENNNTLIETIKSYEKANEKANEASKLVDMKVLHETADQTSKILKQQKSIKIKSIIFTSIFSLIFGAIIAIFASKPAIDLLIKHEQRNYLKNIGFTIAEDDRVMQISSNDANSIVFIGNDGSKILQIQKK
jgi:hypothetical protein